MVVGCLRARGVIRRSGSNAANRLPGRIQVMRKMPYPFVAPVKGVSFHQDVVRAVDVGTPLEVVAEPENEFDANACAVLSGGEVLGHLPREIAGRLRADGDVCWSAEVVEVLRGSKATGLRIRVLAPCPARTPAESLPAKMVSVVDLPSDDARSAAVTREVFARSGRRLGRLVETVDATVRVRTDDDRIVTYPQTLVRLDD